MQKKKGVILKVYLPQKKNSLNRKMEKHKSCRSVIKSDSEKHGQYKRKEQIDRKRRRDLGRWQDVNTEISASMHVVALWRSLKRVENSLPRSSSHKQVVIKAMFGNTVSLTLKKYKRLSSLAKIESKECQLGRKRALSLTI